MVETGTTHFGAGRAGDGRVRATSRAAFILGNGPSLKGVQLPALSAYATIGMNAAYRYWRQIDWRPTHYACLDLVVGLSHKNAIADLIREQRVSRFLLRQNLIDALGAVAHDRRVYSYEALAAQSPFFSNPSITTGSGAALWAAHLNFEQIILLGVDGNYVEFVDGAERRDGIELEIVRDAPNPNYFFENYQQPGDRYNIPNPRPDLHVNAWTAAAQSLADVDVALFNGNPNSAVRAFPFIELQPFLGEGSAVTPGDPPPPAAPAPRNPSRLGVFVQRHRVALAALAALFVLSSGLTAWAFSFAPLAILATTLISAMTAAALAGVLYVRHATATHLNRIQIEIDRMRALSADLERRGGD